MCPVPDFRNLIADLSRRPPPLLWIICVQHVTLWKRTSMGVLPTRSFSQPHIGYSLTYILYIPVRLIRAPHSSCISLYHSDPPVRTNFLARAVALGLHYSNKQTKKNPPSWYLISPPCISLLPVHPKGHPGSHYRGGPIESL